MNKVRFKYSGRIYSNKLDSGDLQGIEESRPWNLTEIIKKHLSENSRLLDVGCGTCVNLIPLSPFAKKIVGLDIWTDSNLETRARRNVKNAKINTIELIKGDARRLPFKDESFDVLTYMLAPDYPSETIRVLKKGGCVIAEHVGEQDKINIKKMFGRDENGKLRGYLLNHKKGATAKMYESDFIHAGFSEVSVQEGLWKTWYTRQGLLLLCQETPLISGFDLNKDRTILDKIYQTYENDDGIESFQHRILIIAKK